MRELALFAGAGGGILAGVLLGWECVCAVEIDAFARSVLLARQRDGSLPWFPVWDDITTFDAKPWRGRVEVVSGGFPCTDISVAGRGDGIDGEQSGLWAHMARVVRDVRPRVVFVENSPALTSLGLGRVLGDLAALGFDAEWGVLGAADVEANHWRERIWILAHTDGGRELQPQGGVTNERRRFSDCNSASPWARSRAAQPGVCRENARLAEELDAHRWGDWREWDIPATVGKLPDRAARLRCLGNGQVPQCAAEAFRQLRARGGW